MAFTLFLGLAIFLSCIFNGDIEMKMKI